MAIRENQILIYQNPDGNIKIDVRLQEETVWLTQKSVGRFFSASKQNISYHLANIFKDGELDENLVVKEILTTAADGKNYPTKFYNLDAIISVGYRISSTSLISKLFQSQLKLGVLTKFLSGVVEINNFRTF